MNQLQNIFYYQGRKVRTVVINDEPWFVAKDACSVLDIENVSLAVNGNPSRKEIGGLEDDEKGVCSVNTLGGIQELLCVTESGLYSLIFKSRKPEAKQFKRWVTHEVIPSIRKSGAYMTDNTLEKALNDPDFLIGLATRLKEEKQARIAAETKLQIDRPKVVFAEALEISTNTILVAELAKLLKQNGIDIGQNRLFERLRRGGYLGSKGEYYNMPTQKSMEMKLFEIKTRSVNNPDGSVRVTKTSKVTGKGQIYFINKLKQELVTT